jgi:hypothetical protein
VSWNSAILAAQMRQLKASRRSGEQIWVTESELPSWARCLDGPMQRLPSGSRATCNVCGHLVRFIQMAYGINFCRRCVKRAQPSTEATEGEP